MVGAATGVGCAGGAGAAPTASQGLKAAAATGAAGGAYSARGDVISLSPYVWRRCTDALLAGGAATYAG